MATISCTANNMAKRFISAKDKKYALNMIVYDINYLVYSNTQEPLKYKDKAAMFTFIFNVIAGREKLMLREGEILVPDFNDIVILFEKRNFILNRLKAGINQQCDLN